jgi:transmembrane sensor
VLTITAVALFSARSGVSTGVGEQRLLTLKDGTRVFLNTATRVVVEYNDNFRKVELDTGEALFDVVNRPGWPFLVQVGDRQVKALGTSFVVRRDEKQLAVTLVEGKVSVTSNPEVAPSGTHANRLPDSATTSNSITLRPGQRLTLAGGNARLETTSLDNAVAWRRGQIVLDDTPLASAIAEMNRYSETRLVIERTESETVLVNGLFQAGDSMSFARAVAATYGLVVVERDDEIILSGTPIASQR